MIWIFLCGWLHGVLILVKVRFAQLKKAETKTELAETKTELAETKTELAETKTELESLLQSALSRITALETQSTS